ncbi:MAG: hypothetical protein WB791_04990 [Waddliaceae bacterium]
MKNLFPQMHGKAGLSTLCRLEFRGCLQIWNQLNLSSFPLGRQGREEVISNEYYPFSFLPS